MVCWCRGVRLRTVAEARSGLIARTFILWSSSVSRVFVFRSEPSQVCYEKAAESMQDR